MFYELKDTNPGISSAETKTEALDAVRLETSNNKVKSIVNLRILTKSSFKKNYSKKMTKTLLLVSFSYAFLNLPYIVAWYAYYNQITLDIDITIKNNLFSKVQITELFNVLNYCIHFFLYCLSGSLFRFQLRETLRIKN